MSYIFGPHDSPPSCIDCDKPMKDGPLPNTWEDQTARCVHCGSVFVLRLVPTYLIVAVERSSSIARYSGYQTLKRAEDVTRPSRQGFVYLIEAPELNMVKIGFSKDPTQRLNQLQGATGAPLRLVSMKEGTGEDEKRLHALYQDFREQGEWFRIEGPLVALVEEGF